MTETTCTRITNVFTAFLGKTSAHGLPQVHTSSGYLKKCTWLCLVMAGFGCLTGHIYTIVQTYLEYNVNVNLKIVNDRAQLFPATTLCNLNPIKKSALEGNPDLLIMPRHGSNRKKRSTETDCTETVAGENYTGTRSVTDRGILCQRWDSQTPHSHRTTDASLFPDSSVSDASNYCRNPDGYFTLWCYTTDPNTRWQNCAVPVCEDPPSCKETDRGSEYSGKISISESGRTCFRWDRWSDLYQNSDFPEDSITEAENYCRNPVSDTRERPWCWVRRNTEYCEIPLCSETSAEEETTLTEETTSFISSSGQTSISRQREATTTVAATTTIAETTTVDGRTTVDETITVDGTTRVDETTTPAETTAVFGATVLEDIASGEHATLGLTTTTEETTHNYVQEIITEQETTVRRRNTGEEMTYESSSVSSVRPTTPFTALTEAGHTINPKFLVEEMLLENLAVLDEETRASLGYQAYEFIVGCQFEGSVCTVEDFYRFSHPVYGNCYTFNSGWNNSVPASYSHRTGRRYGLQVILNVGEDEYLDHVGGPSSARVVIHPQSSMPFPEDEGILAQPGSIVSIGVVRRAHSRQPKPYGNCTSEPLNARDSYTRFFPVRYTRKGCLRTCYQDNLVTSCGCASQYHPMAGDVPVCETANPAQYSCKTAFDREYNRYDSGCEKHCPQACVDEDYQWQTSSAAWPAENYQAKLLEDIADRIPNLLVQNDSNIIRRNLLAVEVYYESFNYREYKEIPVYTVTMFISDVGGVMGLWLGFGVLTAVELLELAFDLLTVALISLKNAPWGKTKKTKQNDNGRGKHREAGAPKSHLETIWFNFTKDKLRKQALFKRQKSGSRV